MAIRRTGSQTLVNRGVTAAAATPVNIITGIGSGGVTVNISSIQIANSTFVAKDDLAIDTTGGFMIINGTGFQSGAVVYIQGTAATSTAFVSSSRLNVTVPALSSGLLDVYVVNTDGSGSIYLRSLNANGTPSWTTTSPLTTQDSGTAFAINLVASGAAGDGTITYAVSSGSSLPSGTFLASNGYFYGTVSGLEAETTYSFSVDAIDAQNQETARSFNITVTAGDTYFRETVLLINGETSNNTWIADASTNNSTLTVRDGARPMAFSPYETVWSNFFDGTGDWLTLPSNSNLLMGSGNFTIEYWIYLSSVSATNESYNTHFSYGSGGNTIRVFTFFANGNYFLDVWTGSSQLIRTVSDAPLYRWAHVAIVRSGSTLTAYVNGTAINSVTNSTDFNAGTLTIGSEAGFGSITGHISNFRAVKGTAVYTSSFTPPTSPLSAVANTSLLTLQYPVGENNHRFVDSSGLNHLVTRAGNATQGTFSPFSQTGWSNYFDGSGDFLTAPSNAAFQFGTGNFTVEFWLNTRDTAFNIVGLNVGGSGNWMAVVLGGNFSWQDAYATTNLFSTSATSILDGVWHHVAITRQSGTTRL